MRAVDSTRRLDLMTAPAVAAYLRRGDAAILAMGPTEAHGQHLPLGCDYLIALATAELAARRADALVLPPFPFSWPGATARLPGTLHLAPDLVLQVVVALLQGAVAQGFRRLALVCAHGPDVHTATLAARLAFERSGRPVAVHHAVPGRGTTPAERELAAVALEREAQDAGQGETSRLLAALDVLGLPATLVDRDAPPARGRPLPAALVEPLRSGGAGFYFDDLPQHIPTPRAVDVAAGQAYLEATAAALAESLESMRSLE